MQGKLPIFYTLLLWQIIQKDLILLSHEKQAELKELRHKYLTGQKDIIDLKQKLEELSSKLYVR